MNLAIFTTVLRLVLVIPIVVCYLTPFPYHQLIAAALFAFASILDWADGYIARATNKVSALGAALDHIADKILIASVLLAITYQLHNLIITICSILIVARELLISGLREYMANDKAYQQVKVNSLGKMKTLMQMVTILFILTPKPFDVPPLLAEGLMVLVVIVTLYSGWVYLISWKRSKT